MVPFDLNLRYSQIRIVDAEGQVLREARVVTSAERLLACSAGHGAMQILLDTGTESEWVAQRLEAAGRFAREDGVWRANKRATKSQVLRFVTIGSRSEFR